MYNSSLFRMVKYTYLPTLQPIHRINIRKLKNLSNLFRTRTQQNLCWKKTKNQKKNLCWPNTLTALPWSGTLKPYVEPGICEWTLHTHVGWRKISVLTTKLDLQLKKHLISGFPGGSVVKNPPASTGDSGAIPDLGRPPMAQSNQAHVPQLLSQCSKACEPQLLKPTGPEPGLHNKRSHRSEKPCSQQWRLTTANI